MELHGRNILIIVENLPLPFDRRVWQEANTLKKAGYGVHIICPKGTKDYKESYECINGIHIYRHNLPFEAKGPLGYLLEYGSALYWERKLSRKIIAKNEIHAVQACNPPDLIYLIVKGLKRRKKIKFVFDHHDINPELYIAKFGRKGFFYKLLLYFERKTFQLCDRSIATNESYKKIAIERGGMDIDKVHIVRSGPSLERTYSVEPDLSLKKGREYLISYVGVIGQQEGISYLIESIDYLVNKLDRKDIHCIIMGSGPDLNNMKDKCDQLRLSEYIEFPGRVTDDYLRRALSTADVCVNPDEYNEMNDKSTMNKIMEYMAIGKPIVQFDLTEGCFSAGKSSLYSKNNDSEDFANQINYLLNNPLLREEMAEFGKKRVLNELQWNFEEPKLLEVYDQIFKEIL